MHRKLPDFMIIGTAKGGSTALYDYLRQHPDLYFPSVKELHFFDVDRNYERGVEWYLNEYFSRNTRGLVQGEATPGYLRNHGTVIPRIKKSYGEISPKFLIILRDPVARAYSHYLHRCRNMAERETFERALELEPTRLAADPNDNAGYYAHGLYADQISAWFDAFPREKFLVLLNEDLKNNRIGTLHNICGFLGTTTEGYAPAPLQSNAHAHPRSPLLMRIINEDNWIRRAGRALAGRTSNRQRIATYLRRANLKAVPKPKMADETREYLRARYQKSIAELETLIDRDLSAWK